MGSSWDNVVLPGDGTGGTARPRQNDQHAVVGAPGSVGLASVCEPLLNAVNFDKPNVLTGLTHNGTWSGWWTQSFPQRRRRDHRRTGGALPIVARTGNLVSPSLSPWESTPRGTPMGGRVEDGGGSEGPAVIAGIAAATIAAPGNRADFRRVVRHERA